LAAAQYERNEGARSAELRAILAQPGGIDALQSGGPLPSAPAADPGAATLRHSPADDPSSLDQAAARLRDVAAGKAPATQLAWPPGLTPPAAGTPSPTSLSIALPASSSIPSPPHTGDRLPLSQPHHVRLGEPGSRPDGPTSLLTIGSSLAVVLGLFLLVAWAVKRATPGRSGLLPTEVVEVLGRASLGARQQVHLVRCGSKLLLVSATPGGMETLTEIAEPDEVQRLAALCRQTQPGSTTAAFRQVFHQLAAGAEHDA
jgi:flagellar biogenesis protein FliO